MSNPSNSVLIMENGSLTISVIGKDDEGVYQCTVSNEVGTPLEKSATLRVIGEKNLKNKYFFHTIRGFYCPVLNMFY